MTDYGLAIFDQHAAMLAASNVAPEHARARGYVSVDTKVRLAKLGVTKAGRLVPGLLVPMRDKAGQVWGYQYRPDTPRLNGAGKPVKYETPTGQRNGIDVPPGVGPALDDPTVPLWITEGAKKADAAACAGIACVALAGVWSWRGTNVNGGKVAVPDWHDIALNGRQVVLAFDSDVVRKREVRTALGQLAGYLASKGASVRYLHLPHDDDAKCGLDDYLAAGHTVDELRALVRPEPPEVVGDPLPEPPPRPALPAPEPRTLADTLDVFKRWLHLNDTAPVLAVAAAIVANRAAGDPVWLLVVGPPSGGKTEIISSAASLPYIVKAATVSEAALLSGTASREQAANATGGLLRMVGVIPQPEGPARLVLGLRHLYGGLEAIGVDEPGRWAVVARVARDCVPAIRTKLIRRLVAKTGAARTSELAAAVGMVTKTAHRHLEDLALLGLADRTKESEADNAADWWAASDWLRKFWPAPVSETEMYVRTGSGLVRGLDERTPDTPTDTPLRTSLSHSDGCPDCGQPLDQRAGPGCPAPVTHRPADIWSTP